MKPIEVYLVTGFLGSGKTTLIGQLLQMLNAGRVRLIVNEFGKAGVDGALLRQFDASVDEIVDGSIFCACRLDQFEKALDRVAADGPDALVVEASGLSDPAGMRAILRSPRYGGRYAYRGAICLVDPLRFEKVLATARVVARQLSVAQLALVNKSDLAGEEQLAACEALLAGRWPELPVRRTSFGRLQPEWLALLQGQQSPGESEDIVQKRDITLQKKSLRIHEGMAPEQLRYFLRRFAEHSHRIKGVVRLAGALWLVDCVGADVRVEPYAGQPTADTGRVVALAGRGQPLARSLREAAEAYAEWVEIEQLG